MHEFSLSIQCKCIEYVPLYAYRFICNPIRPFCVEFACSPRVYKGFPPLRTPTEKHAKEQNTLLSVLDQDGRVTSLGPRALRSCPLLLEDPGGGTIRDGLKAEQKFTATSGL